jgi:hypothetical protein
MANQYNKNTTKLLDDVNRMCKTGALQAESCLSLTNSINKMETATVLDTTNSLDGDYENYQKNYGIYLDDTMRFKSHTVDLQNLKPFRLKTFGNKYLGYKDGKLMFFKESDLLNDKNVLSYTLINTESVKDTTTGANLNHFYITFNGLGNSGSGSINNHLTLGENDSVIVSRQHQLKSLWKFIKYNEQYYIESVYRPKHYLDTSTNFSSSSFFIGFGKTETGKWSIKEDSKVNDTPKPPFSLSDSTTADSIYTINGLLNNKSNTGGSPEERRLRNIIDTTILNNMTGTNCDIESFRNINSNTIQNLEKLIRQFYISEEKVNEIEKAFRNKLLEIAKLENNIEELEATIISSRKQSADNISSLETTPKEKSIRLPFGGAYKIVNQDYIMFESAISQIKKTIQESEKKKEDHKINLERLNLELPILEKAVQDAKIKRGKTVVFSQTLKQKLEGFTIFEPFGDKVNGRNELGEIINNIAELERRNADSKDREILQTVQRGISNLTRERSNIKRELQYKNQKINDEQRKLQKIQEDKQHEFEQNQTINRNVIKENEDINKKLTDLEDKENELYSNSHLMGTNLKVIERQNTKLKYQTHALKSAVVLFSMIIIILLLVIIKKIIIG